jgi:hypothetical protein
VFVLAVLSRLFIFNNQIYGFGLMSQLRSAPVATLLSVVQEFFISLWAVLVAAWIQMFAAINPSVHGIRTIALYIAVTLIVFVLAVFVLFKQNQDMWNQRDRSMRLVLVYSCCHLRGAVLVDGLSISLRPADRFTAIHAGCKPDISRMIDLIPATRLRYLLLAY